MAELPTIHDSAPWPRDVERAIERLRSLHVGDLGVLEVTACGPRAIPALRALLYERESSGLYEARRRAVWALAALGACDPLIEFLTRHRDAADPVERLGDDAVVNAAAEGLAGLRTEQVFQVLLTIARRRVLPGVIRGLAGFKRPETIPLFVEALGEDDSRRAAEDALRELGERAYGSLVEAAIAPMPSPADESESSRRRRRSALGLLADLRATGTAWPRLRHLVHDADDRIAVLACCICLSDGEIGEKYVAVERLVRLLRKVDWMLADDIEDCLVAHFEEAKDIVTAELLDDAGANDDFPGSRAHHRLRRFFGVP